jgi:hypothetical protein
LTIPILIKFILGTSISVFGQIGNNSIAGKPSGSFVLDSQSPSNFAAQPQSSSVFNQPLYTSNSIPAGTHTLIINALGDAPLLIDYILIHPNPSTPSTSANAGTSHSQTALSQSTLIGIVIAAAVVVIAGCIVGCILVRRSKKTKKTPPQLLLGKAGLVSLPTVNEPKTQTPSRPPRMSLIFHRLILVS